MRRILYPGILLLVFTFSNYLSTKAQTDGVGCGTSKAMEELYRARPDSRQKALDFDHFHEKFSSARVMDEAPETSYVIPVVFHVFGTDFLGQSVTQEIIEDALTKLNEDFNGLNHDWDDVSALFSGIKATLDIEFKLAKIDPNGNATTGVTWNPSKAGFGSGGGYDNDIQQYAWDNYKYMNVYIMLDLYNDGSTNRSGVAWYPDEWMSNNNLARVVYNGRYLGTNTDENFRRVLTHEFGHYLNLAHTFDNECAAPGDNVDDTPATTSNSGTCNVSVEMCDGAGPANGENFMDYSECYRMFTQGQVDRMKAALNHSTRQPLWQPENLVATGVDGIGAHLLISTTSFLENQSNDGSIDGSANITAENEASFAITGELTEGDHYTIENLPEGLSVSITVDNSTSASLTITGNALAHEAENGVDNVTITFLDAAITGDIAELFSDVLTVSIDFADPYQIVYHDMDNVTVNSGSTWDYFSIVLNDQGYGAWYSSGKLKLETYKKSMICEGETYNLTKLSYGDEINASSNWVEGGDYPNQHDLRTDTYTDWDGQSGYLGFQVTNSLGWNVNGWFRVSVSASGDEYTVYDYAYHEDPNATIKAGHTGEGDGGNIWLSSDGFIEASANDGNIASTIDLSVEGSSFAVTGTLEEGTHYTISGVPDGLTAQVTLSDANNGSWSLSGTSASHTDDDDTEIQLTFLDAAITGGVATLTSATLTANVNFNDPYEIVYVDMDDITVDENSTWNPFTLVNNNSIGLWYDNGKLRLETYKNPLISEGDTRNASVLAYGDPISSTSNWVAGGDYPDEHNVTSSTYTDWYGRSGYIGFQIPNEGGTLIHGWLRIDVNDDGSAFTAYDYAYAEDPTVTLPAGYTELGDAAVADFTASATTIEVGESISFTDLSTENPTAWNWTFSGATTTSSSEQNPEVTYNTAGEYAVTLEVSNPFGSDELTRAAYITVNEVVIPNQAPVLAEIDDQSVEEGNTLTFTATATDPDEPAQTLTFSLDEESSDLGMTIKAPTGVFSWSPTSQQIGEFEAIVIVSDGEDTDQKSVKITVTAKKITGINNPEGLISFFPNPVQDKLTTLIESPYIGMVKMQVISMTGKIMIEHETMKSNKRIEFEINTDDFDQGLYFIKLKQGSKIILHRLLKIHNNN